jgi:hypothetical protein
MISVLEPWGRVWVEDDVFWDKTAWCSGEKYRRFGGHYGLYLQGHDTLSLMETERERESSAW